jgi:DNA-binding response OmpR family regulator
MAQHLSLDYHMKKILIVDDDSQSLEIIEMFLEEYFEVYTFNCPVEAVGYITKEKPKIDLFLLDWMMPKLTGVEVFHMIRNTGYDTVPVIMTTGRATYNDINIVHNEGIDGILTKPFEQDDLIDKINKHI